MKCVRCGNEFMPTTVHDVHCFTCRSYEQWPPIKQYEAAPMPAPSMGWVCPRCGIVHSPWTLTCECKPPVLTTTGTTTTPNAERQRPGDSRYAERSCSAIKSKGETP